MVENYSVLQLTGMWPSGMFCLVTVSIDIAFLLQSIKYNSTRGTSKYFAMLCLFVYAFLKCGCYRKYGFSLVTKYKKINQA